MIFAVLDTNTVISALFWGGIPRKAYRAAQTHYSLLTTEDLIAELDAVLHRPKFVDFLTQIGQTPEDILSVYRGLSHIVAPVEIPEDVVRDPKDRIVLECAVGGHADYVISGDKDLLVLERYANIPIISAVRFIEILESDSA